MKVFIVSTLQPFGHYTQILTNAFTRNSDLEVFVAAEKDSKNRALQYCGTVFAIWEKGPFFFIPILKKINQVKPDIIHIQHEFMMYGGALSSLMFPVFLFIVKMMGYHVVVTIHAVLDLDNLNDEFISAFHVKSFLAKPFFLKNFFLLIIRLVSCFAECIVCHTETASTMLIKQYHLTKKQIHVLPACIPEKRVHNKNPEKYFLYYGYMTPRKGLENVIKAFIAFHKVDPSYRFILAGGTIPGQEKYVENLKKQIVTYPFIEFRGEMTDETVLDQLYQKAYVVVNPAKINVGSSGPLYQARGYHSCILASNVDHLKEDIIHLENGLLTDNNRWDEAFREITTNSTLRKKLVTNTVLLAQLRSPEKTAQHYRHLYSQIISHES